MPRMESYISEVTVSVVLKSTDAGTVAEYSVTRKAKGLSADPGEHLEVQAGASRVIDAATTDAVAGSRALMAGVQNAERRRLK